VTLIAAFTRHETPFLLSDVLQIRIGEEVSHTQVATAPAVERTLTPEYWRSVCDPMQKAYVVNPDLCIAVAGDSYRCRDAIREVKREFDTYTPVLPEFAKWLSAQLGPGKLEVTLLGWINGPDGMHSFRWRSGDPDHIDTDRNFCEGTGAAAFRDLMGRPAAASFSATPYAQMYPFSRGRVAVLADVGEMVNMQLRGNFGLLQEFGGGFQLLFFDGSQFRPVERYNFIYCDGYIDSGGSWEVVIGGPLIFQYYFEGRFSIIRVDIEGRKILAPASAPMTIRDHPVVNVTQGFSDEEPVDQGLVLEAAFETNFYLLPFIWHWHDGYKQMTTGVVGRTLHGRRTFAIRKVDGRLIMECGPAAHDVLSNLAQRAIRLRRESPDLSATMIFDP
jgi:hypothetical protein